MREGTKVTTKNSDEVGVIKTIIGNVAIVNYGDISRKELLSNLIEVEKIVTQKDFIEVHQDMLSNESIQSFFEEKLSNGEMGYYRMVLRSFGAEMFTKLFNENES